MRDHPVAGLGRVEWRWCTPMQPPLPYAWQLTERGHARFVGPSLHDARATDKCARAGRVRSQGGAAEGRGAAGGHVCRAHQHQQKVRRLAEGVRSGQKGFRLTLLV